MFKIGYAPSNTLEIFYISRISWWGKSDDLFLLGLGAAAFALYFDNTSETGWFVSGGIGFSSLSKFRLLDVKGTGRSYSGSGFGLFGGSGLRIFKTLDCRGRFTLFSCYRRRQRY